MVWLQNMCPGLGITSFILCWLTTCFRCLSIFSPNRSTYYSTLLTSTFATILPDIPFYKVIHRCMPLQTLTTNIFWFWKQLHLKSDITSTVTLETHCVQYNFDLNKSPNSDNHSILTQVRISPISWHCSNWDLGKPSIYCIMMTLTITITLTYSVTQGTA
jgi:hypothetical protein